MGRIELYLREASQLFNSMDPSPFRDKDLDRDAEQFIVDWAREYPLGESLELTVHLEQAPPPEHQRTIPEAVLNFFAYRGKLNRLAFRRLMREGRVSLLIGALFLAACLSISRLLQAHGVGPWSNFVRESLTIAGWVAMWRPLQIYLYDWWPVRRRGRTYDKLSRMPVEVVGRGAADPRRGD